MESEPEFRALSVDFCTGGAMTTVVLLSTSSGIGVSVVDSALRALASSTRGYGGTCGACFQAQALCRT